MRQPGYAPCRPSEYSKTRIAIDKLTAVSGLNGPLPRTPAGAFDASLQDSALSRLPVDGRQLAQNMLRACDDGRCRTVADYIHGRPSHIHQGIDSQNQHDRREGNMDGTGRGHEDDQYGARYACYTFAGQHQRSKHGNLLADAEVNPPGLSYEYSGHGEIDGRAGQVKTVSGRDHE